MCPIQPAGRNPVGVGNSTINRSQGSRNGNPGLEDATALRFTKHKAHKPKLKELLLPRRAVWKLVVIKRLWFHLDAVAGIERWHVTAILYHYRKDKMFV